MNNNIITDRRVSLQTAVLLKNKGFKVPTDSTFVLNWELEGLDPNGALYDKVKKNPLIGRSVNNFVNDHENRISKPTQTIVIEWIRINFGIFMWAESYGNDDKYVPQIPMANNDKVLGYFDNPQDALEIAIQYCLIHLIK